MKTTPEVAKRNNEIIRKFLSDIASRGHEKLKKERPEYYSEIQRQKQKKSTLAKNKAKKARLAKLSTE